MFFTFEIRTGIEELISLELILNSRFSQTTYKVQHALENSKVHEHGTNSFLERPPNCNCT